MTRRWTAPQVVILIAMLALALYFIVPIYWLAIASTKSTQELATTPAFWFAEPQFWKNVTDLFSREDGIFPRWMVNSALYSGVGALGAMLVSAMAGYGIDKYRFRGRETLFAVILGSLMIPITLLALPLFLLLSRVGLVDTYLAVILPSLVSPFGVYLCRVYASVAVPDELIEAARIDGASELAIFFRVSLRIMAPALVTVFLFEFVAIWNNFFLPLMVLRNRSLYPVTLGLFNWNSVVDQDPDVVRLVITGSLISVIPLAILFFSLQRYWQAGLTDGSLK